MHKLKYLIDGKMDEYFERSLGLFGSDSPDDNDSSGGLSDEDFDEDLQQDIAARAVQLRGGDIGGYQFDPDFERDDNNYLAAATATYWQTLRMPRPVRCRLRLIKRLQMPLRTSLLVMQQSGSQRTSTAVCRLWHACIYPSRYQHPVARCHSCHSH